MARLKSFVQRVGPEGTSETPCFTCAHCNTIHEVPTKDKPYGFCRKCMHPVCIRCGGSERCVPFEKKIEQYESKMRMLKAMKG